MPATLEDKKVATKKPGREEFRKRANALKREGLLWYPAWKDLSTYEYPTRGAFDTDIPNKGYEIDHTTVVDGHATLDIDIMSAGMLSGMTSPGRPWFKLALSNYELNEFTPVKLWLDEVTKRMLFVFSKSNIYGMLQSVYSEIGTFGTACAFLEENFKEVIRGRVYTAGEYYLGVGPDGKVNALYRRFWMQVGNIVKEFGIENVCDSTKTDYENNQVDNWKVINFLVEENDDRIPYMRDKYNMPYRAIYWEDGAEDNKYLMLGGYEEFPLVAPRWETTTSVDIYGKGPGWKALGDVKMLQELQKEKFIALAKVGNPPVQRDASVQGDVDLLPGGVTTFSALVPNGGLKPAYQVNPDINALEGSIEKTKQAIDRYFFANLFMMLIEAERQGREITATEIMEKQSEKLSLLGPVLERLEGELLTPLIERTYNIMERHGLLPEPPSEMQGLDIHIVYISVLAQAQKMLELNAVDQWMAGVGNSAAISPDAPDIVNVDEVNRDRADVLGVAAKLVNSPEKMVAMRAERRKQQEALAKQQAALALADAAKKGASAVKDMSQAPMGPGSALDSALGALKGAQ